MSQQTIGQVAQGSAVTVALVAEPMIVLAASGMALHAYSGPLIKRVAEAEAATVAHEYRRFFPLCRVAGATPA
jgi:hypothetical protein